MSSTAIDDAPPWQADQEWANAATHGFAAIVSILAGAWLISQAWAISSGMTLACLAYLASIVGTFTFSTLSHLVPPSPLLNRLRAWDQAMIYTMIAGTYTPIIVRFAPSTVSAWLLPAMWAAAIAGFVSKVAIAHRVNSIGTLSYILLGWLPAMPLSPHVTDIVVRGMFAGGIVYSLGVVMLMNDHRIRYLHAGWHLMVMTAASIHFWMIGWHVATT
ncbi:MAG: hemolysin III family protein [Planctomycetota bacterium]